MHRPGPLPRRASAAAARPRDLLPALGLALSLALGSAGCGDADPVAPPPRFPPYTAQQAGVEIAPGLVTSGIGDRCVECHADVVEAYSTSGMFHAMSLPTGAESVEAGLVGRTVVHEPTGITVRFGLRDGKYVQRTVYVDPEGVERAHFERPIDLVVGSGHATRSYFHADERGQLYLLHLTWYREIDDLSLSPGPGFLSIAQRLARRLCVSCHTGQVELKDPDSDLGYQGRISMGVACERCHGDGEMHVLTGDPHDVVNPARLDVERQSEVCYQCHLSGSLEIPKTGHSVAEDFTPGEPLGLHYGVFDPVRAAGDVDHGTSIAGHASRMRLSRCFTESQSRHGMALTCTTCHNPHEGFRKPLEQRGSAGGCFVCHTQESCGLPRPDRGDRPCFECHMAVVPSSDIVHTKTTDHFIATIPPLPPERRLTPEERSIGAHALADRPLENVLDPEGELPGAKLLLAQAYAEGVDFAWTVFDRFAEGYALRAERLATEILEEHPDDTGALLVRARARLQKGDGDAAIRDVARVHELVPPHAESWRMLGRAQSVAHRYGESAASLEQALALNPADELVAGLLVDVLWRAERHREALDVLDRCRAVAGPTLNQAARGLRIAWELGDGRRALAHAYDRLLFRPRDAAAVADAADVWLDVLRDAARARPLYEEAVRLDPGYVPALARLARLEYEAARFDAARELAARARRLEPDSPAVRELDGLIR